MNIYMGYLIFIFLIEITEIEIDSAYSPSLLGLSLWLLSITNKPFLSQRYAFSLIAF